VLFVGAPKVRDATGGPLRVVALTPEVPAFDLSRLTGTWKSEHPERIQRADGSVVYLTREFRFAESAWDIHFEMTREAGDSEPTLSGDFGGPLEVGPFSPLADAFEARFQFTRDPHRRERADGRRP
jgi:hypothetical protein